MSVMIAFTSLLITVALSALTPPSIWLARSLKITPISARLAWGAVAAVTPSARPTGAARNPFAPSWVARAARLASLWTMSRMSRWLVRNADSAAATLPNSPPPFTEAVAAESAVVMSASIVLTWVSVSPVNCPAATSA
jgi:hypothetical protein